MDEAEETPNSYLVGDPSTYGEPFLQYLNDHSIGWVACWYDDEWLPPMFTEGRKDFTQYGRFVLQQLRPEE